MQGSETPKAKSGSPVVAASDIGALRRVRRSAADDGQSNDGDVGDDSDAETDERDLDSDGDGTTGDDKSPDSGDVESHR